ncbi:DNA primase [Variovorax sp. VNK109]|uniref:DNA primase n=1 Tax=Variovorax sp. VNK109 TaxID=3400919 RepID=UPI003C0BABE9
MAIPQTFVQELLARADVVEIVGRHVQLKKGGANFMGLCPFHGEKSPSFSVSPTKQFYHCFGCGKHGDAISFLMEHTGSTFVEAVHDLAQQYGMQVPEDDASPADRARAAEQRQKQATLFDVLEKAGEAFRKNLKNSPRAIDYFKRRGVSGEIARRFGLGYAPEGWRALASVFPDYADPLLVESGLVITNEDEGGSDEKRYDRFRDRVMFPIRNIKGECIGFGGRVLGDEKPKYLNSPETPVFSKGRELYGLFEAREAIRDAGYVLVTEGYMDVVALAQLGFPHAVATLGTACTTDHVQKLFRFTDSVVFSFDGDAAGRRAARKALDGALPYAQDTRTVKFLFLPAEHDPDSYIREFGADAFSRYVSEATPLSRFLVDSAREGCDLTTAEGRAHMASNARPLWMQLPDGALKRQMLGEIAQLAQLDASELASLWGQKTSTGRTGGNRSGGGWNGTPASSAGYTTPRRATRTLPPGRADRALQIVFMDSAAWAALGHDDHQLLCDLAPPHGPLFAWLDSQVQEHGPLPWAELQQALQGHALENHAVTQISKVFEQIENDPGELQRILQMERKRLRDEEKADLSRRAASDPEAYARLRELIAEDKVGPAA